MNNFKKISYNEREQILKLSSQGKSQREIAEAIGKNQSNISRELRRNGMNRDTYSIVVAQVNHNQKASLKGRKKKLCQSPSLLEFIREKIIELHWSPEQVSGWLRRDKRSRQISHETIYSYIYSLEESERAVWIKALRRKRKKRRSRKDKKEKRGKIPNRVSIHERPKTIDERKEYGHWEGDTVVGCHHASAIGTSVERVSRYTIIVPLNDKKTSKFVVEGFSKELNNLPDSLKKSLTYDNGTEMTLHKILTEKTGMPVYFADPGCPGQRGTNENTNGLVREFFPKGTDFNTVSREELKKVEKLLNQRPRKILNYATPEEVLAKQKRRLRERHY